MSTGVEAEVSTSDPIERARENWVRAGWTEAADGMALVTSITRVQQLLQAEIDAILRPRGLTFARFEVLRLLAFSSSGLLPVGKLGERLQVHPASVTNAVQRLEEDGHVERRTNPDDRRSVLAKITPAGRDLAERCTALLNDGVFASLPLDVGQVEQGIDVLTSLRRALGDPT